MRDNFSGLKRVLVTGGAGYVGAVLVPRLLGEGYEVCVLDLYIYGEDSLDAVRSNPGLKEIKGDIRHKDTLKRAIERCDAVIHLACISNDPSVELDPELSKTINYEAFKSLVGISKTSGVKRFIFASSGSVYGITEDRDVTEEHELVPVSLYNKYKALCETVLLEQQSREFAAVTVRPATTYGYSPRQRLDLTVNILTAHAVCADKITVFGGKQMRPNIHIHDIVDLYIMLLEAPVEKIAGEIFNAAYDNYSVAQTAEIVKSTVEREIPEKRGIKIMTTPSDDVRSYHLCSEKIKRVLGFEPKRSIEIGVHDLTRAFRAGKLTDPLNNSFYYNIKRMKEISLK